MKTNVQFAPPAPDEIEVSVFGPGYGETILLHLGGGKWILVDSCVDPVSGLPASVKYLGDLNLNIEDAIELVVATHWHDDHIRGISTVFSECRSAEFAISSALTVDEFLALAALYQERPIMRSSGLNEFTRVFQILDTRKQRRIRFNPVKFASADRLIYRDQIRIATEPVEATIFALSPSDASVLQAKLAFADLLPEKTESKKRIAAPTPNHASVVLWIEVGTQKILLGADLENTGDAKTGWSVILSDSTAVSGRADVFKIPHHGSENAHHEQVWTELLFEEPLAVVTPFRGGKKPLPSHEDIKRITRLTPHAYATAPPERRRWRWRERVVRDTVEQATRSRQRIHHGWGHVRCRRMIDEENSPWRVELFGDAYALNDAT